MINRVLWASMSIVFTQVVHAMYYDKETGLEYNYYRDRDAQTGRYIQSDPLGLGGGLNPYAYVRGNPLQRSDPLGLADVDPLSFLGGGGVGSAAGGGPMGYGPASASVIPGMVGLVGPARLISASQRPAYVPTSEDLLAAGGILAGSYAVGVVASVVPSTAYAVCRAAVTIKDPCKNPIIAATLGMAICRGDPPDEFLQDVQRRQQIQTQSGLNQSGRPSVQGGR